MTSNSSLDVVSPAARIALKNARFVDVARGSYYPPEVRMVLKDGLIEAMPGLSGQPEDMPVDGQIDLQGKAVIPGLFNTHCHIQLKYPSMFISPGDIGLLKKNSSLQIEQSMASCRAHGVTHLRDALSGDLRPNRKLRERIEHGEIPGPRIQQCVHVSPLGGTYTRPHSLFDVLVSFLSGGALLDYDHEASGVIAFPVDAGERQVRDAVDQAIDRHGADCIKLYDQREFSPTYAPGAKIMSDAQMAAAVDQAHRRGVKATLHHLTVESLRRGVRAGVDSFAHLPIDGLLTAADVDAFRQAGCILESTATLIYYLAWAIPGAPWGSHPRMARLDAFRSGTYPGIVKEFWIPELQASAGSHFIKAAQGKFKILGLMDMSAPVRYWGRMIDQGIENLRRLYDAGVPVACGSDAGAASATEAMAQLELAMLDFCLNGDDRSGCFTPADALRAATLHSARALGVETSYGSLEPGKIADLVVLDGDPLKDISRIGAQAGAVFMQAQMKINACGLHVV